MPPVTRNERNQMNRETLLDAALAVFIALALLGLFLHSLGALFPL